MTEFYQPLTTNLQHSWRHSRSRRVTALSRLPALLMRTDYVAKEFGVPIISRDTGWTCISALGLLAASLDLTLSVLDRI